MAQKNTDTEPDKARTDEARKVAEELANDLREIIKKMPKPPMH